MEFDVNFSDQSVEVLMNSKTAQMEAAKTEKKSEMTSGRLRPQYRPSLYLHV